MISQSQYASYLLRFRQVRNDQRTVWAASAQCIATGEQRPFADVEDLVEFLRAEFGGRESAEDAFQPPQIILERELKALAQGLGPFSGSS